MKRKAVTLLEVIISVGLLVVACGFIARVASSSMQGWKHTRHQQLALDEVANRMDELLQVPSESRQQAMDAIAPSDWISESLHEPKLIATLTDDQLGRRITVELSWNESVQRAQVRLVGWLNDEVTSETSQEVTQ